VAHIQKRTRSGKAAYVARYLDHEDQERSRSFRTEREAERFLIQVEAAKLNGSYLDPGASRLTFNQWADQWWQVWAADPDRSPTTLGAADSRLRCHLRPTFGDAGWARSRRPPSASGSTSCAARSWSTAPSWPAAHS
jgi:hypothetical protein